MITSAGIDYAALATDIKTWGGELGFQKLGVTGIELDDAQARLAAWLDKGYHGEMAYMQRHGSKRSQPEELVPGTARVITARMDYRPAAKDTETVLSDSAGRVRLPLCTGTGLP